MLTSSSFNGKPCEELLASSPLAYCSYKRAASRSAIPSQTLETGDMSRILPAAKWQSG